MGFREILWSHCNKAAAKEIYYLIVTSQASGLRSLGAAGNSFLGHVVTAWAQRTGRADLKSSIKTAQKGEVASYFVYVIQSITFAPEVLHRGAETSGAHVQ